MFFNADDDEQDFMSTGGSKLANLFGMDKASGQGGNASLTYTAPKQPKKKDPVPEGSAATTATPAVVVASVVHAYKYVDQKYASQGKLGVALLATQATKDFRILLYVNRQTQVTNARITSTFGFNVQQNNYASFYDDAAQMWSIMFETAEAAEKFAKETAILKASLGSVTDLIQQELTLGDGGGLENGDSAEVKYTGWLFTNGTFGKVFDQSAGENYFRFRVGKGKVIKGWDQGMLGMKKGGKRLLIIPPSLAYGSQGVGDKVPPNSTLIFEVQLVRVKLQKGESPQETPAPTPLPTLPTQSDQDDFDDPGVKGRTRSINEQLSQSSDSDKAKLISRMARMGQPMLPFQGAIAAQPDDSDEELHHHQIQQPAPSPGKPPLPTKPRSGSGVGLAVTGHMGQVIVSQAQPTVVHPGVAMVGGQPMMLSSSGEILQQQPAFLQNLPGAQQLAVYQNPNTFLQQQQQQQAALLQQQQQLFQQQQQQQFLSQAVGAVPVQASPFGIAPPSVSTPQTPSSTSSSSADALAPVLLTETRQQNTEVRIGLSKMSDKVDKILEKVEHLSATGIGAHAMGMIAPYGASMPAPSMEANVLMQNITRIVQENERLKKEVYEQSGKVQELNDKITNLLDKNQKYVEQSQNLLEQRNEGYKHTASQSQARVLALEQEKVQLATELSSSSAQISTLQLELGDYRKREGELKQQLQVTGSSSNSSREELEKLRLQKEEDEQKINTLSANIRDEKLARKSLETKLASHLEEFAEMKSANETLEKNLSERKRKAAEERRKLEEDMEDSKINYETTIEGLRERLRKQKSSVDADAQSKMSKIEEEISREWQLKSERMLITASEKHNRQMADLKDEKEDLERKVAELEKKLANIRSSGSSTEHQMSQLQDELAEMKVWKDKYDNLRSQASNMKERYDKRIGELEGEKEEEEERRNELAEKAREQQQELQQRIHQLQQEVHQQQAQLSTRAVTVQRSEAPSPAPSSDVATEVKKVMNSVYQNLRGEFDADDSYQGSEVLSTILGVIKQTTLKLVAPPSERQESVEDEEEAEGEEEEDEEEEEENTEDEEMEGSDEVDSAKGKEKEEPNKEEDEIQVAKASTTETNAPFPTSEIEEPLEEQEETFADAEEGSQSPGASPSMSDPNLVTVYERLPQTTNGNREDDINNKDNDKRKAENEENNDLPADNEDDFSDDVQVDNKAEHDSEKDDRQERLNVSNNNTENENLKLSPETATEPHAITRKDEEAATILATENAETTADVKVSNGVTSDSPTHDPTSESPTESKTNEQSKKPEKDVPVKPVAKIANDSKEPPPLFDEDDDDEDSSLFGNDGTASEALDSALKPKSAGSGKDVKATAASASKSAAPVTKDKAPTGKKLDMVNDEDLKPQPPPPLFGDDSDDDDLDWLS